MPEALEKWPVKVLGKLLPRHMEIIDKIDQIWKDSLKVHALRTLPHGCPGCWRAAASALVLPWQSLVAQGVAVQSTPGWGMAASPQWQLHLLESFGLCRAPNADQMGSAHGHLHAMAVKR